MAYKFKHPQDGVCLFLSPIYEADDTLARQDAIKRTFVLFSKRGLTRKELLASKELTLQLG